MTHEILSEHRTIWYDKPALRAIYTDYYQEIVAQCVPGRSLEIGGGSGNLKEFATDVVSTDIVPSEWLDAAADAHALPFADKSFANIVMVDVLHHLERPVKFFAEVTRVLQPGGRVVMLEPGITPVSWLFFKAFHPEPVIMDVDPLLDGALSSDRAPFDANQAIPTVLFGRDRSRFEAAFPNLTVCSKRWLSLFAYPLSGGFRPWSLISAGMARGLLQLERSLSPLIGRWVGFRLLVVLEYTPTVSSPDGVIPVHVNS
jgi:SAM-dependent methyltransferase